MSGELYRADPSLKGKIRRRLVRLHRKNPLRTRPPGPMISFTFDDAPASAAIAGAAILETHGARGTYFVCGGLAGTEFATGLQASADQLKALHAAGHEIACHTHQHLDCGRASAPQVAAALDANRECLERLGLPRPVSFAYPYGDVSHGAKNEAARRFGLSRALHHGTVGLGTDLNQAPAVGIEGKDGFSTVHGWMDRAHASGDWLIVFTHGVTHTPGPFDATPDHFEQLVAKAHKDGFDIITIKQAMDRLGVSAA
jgi:peptidoglycan/xylan/chitin deacetylase (PgdA/CDA1 family)